MTHHLDDARRVEARTNVIKLDDKSTLAARQARNLREIARQYDKLPPVELTKDGIVPGIRITDRDPGDETQEGRL